MGTAKSRTEAPSRTEEELVPTTSSSDASDRRPGGHHGDNASSSSGTTTATAIPAGGTLLSSPGGRGLKKKYTKKASFKSVSEFRHSIFFHEMRVNKMWTKKRVHHDLAREPGVTKVYFVCRTCASKKRRHKRRPFGNNKKTMMGDDDTIPSSCTASLL